MEYMLLMREPAALPEYLRDKIDAGQKFVTEDSVTMNGQLVLANIDIGGVSYSVHKPDERGFIVKRIFHTDPSEPDPVLREWGPYKDIHRLGQLLPDRSIRSWFFEQITQGNLPSLTHDLNVRLRLDCFVPIRSELSIDKVAIYQNRDKRHQDLHTAMKPGRAFSMMFPEMDHKELIQLVDRYLQTFAKRNLTLHTGKSAEDFKHAYAGTQSHTENIQTTFSRKSLACSCMRYDFDHLPIHPVEAYASGDFEIIWTEDQDKNISSRAVARVKDGVYHCGPVYGVSESSIDMIEHHVLSNGGHLLDNAVWVGARLVKHIYDEHDQSYIAPYLDVAPQSLEDDGNSLVIIRGGSIPATDYQGILNGSYCSCHSCGDSISHEDDAFYSDYTGESYCESCFWDDHIYCDFSQDTYHTDQCDSAYVEYRFGDYQSQLVSIDALGSGCDFVQCSDDNWWHIDLAHYCEFEGEHISERDMDDYFVCEVSGELFPNSEVRQTAKGQVAEYTMKNSGDNWVQDSDGLWYIKEEEEEE